MTDLINKRNQNIFWYELVKRVVGLANALQYDNTYYLINLAVAASEEDELPDDIVMDAWHEIKWQMEIMMFDKEREYDHDAYCKAIDSLEKWLEDNKLIGEP